MSFGSVPSPSDEKGGQGPAVAVVSGPADVVAPVVAEFLTPTS